MIIGTTKYANIRGLSDGYIRKCIITGKPLEGVIAYQKLGKTHLLTVHIPTLAKCINVSEKKLVQMLAD